MNSKVLVVGLGVVSAIGRGVVEIHRSLQLDNSGIGEARHLRTNLELPVGEVKLSNDSLKDLLSVKDRIPRTALLGLLAARDALADSTLDLTGWRTGLISATTVGGMDFTENYFEENLEDLSDGNRDDVRNHECGKITQLIAEDLNVTDFVTTVNTACSSSANSIIFGARLIAQGHLDIVVAGGADALCRFTLNGFNSLRILDYRQCRPFDASRAGLNLGEGAAYVVLASDRVVQMDKIKSLCCISGFGNSSDAFHQTTSSSEGEGSFLAMRESLKRADLEANQISYINLHGTGTENNDLSEGMAIKRLFGSNLPMMSSTKGFTGHTLGASGGLEAVFSIMSIAHGCVYPNLGFENSIPELGIIPQLKFGNDLPIRHVMSNSFGFGGNCSSIIFSVK
ncbi:MAG: beta-ketoacyl-[acyl-carrier-protein] synthase family protein [Cyclobacteriaceae bacterium]